MKHAWILGAAATLVVACRDSTPPELSQPAKFLLVSGDAQTFSTWPGAPVRRLIVEFKPGAAGLSSSVVSGALLSRAATTMRSALAVHAARGLVTRLEASPAILATRVTVPDSVRLEDAVAALAGD